MVRRVGRAYQDRLSGAYEGADCGSPPGSRREGQLGRVREELGGSIVGFWLYSTSVRVFADIATDADTLKRLGKSSVRPRVLRIDCSALRFSGFFRASII